MLPIVQEIILIYKEKIRIFGYLRHYLKPVEEIIREPALGYMDDKEKFIRHFRELLEKLHQVNNRLMHVETHTNISSLDPSIAERWEQMKEWLKDEHEIFAEDLKPAIEGILEREDWQEWLSQLEYFKDFLVIMRKELRLFNSLIKEIATKQNLVESKERLIQLAAEKFSRKIAFFQELFRKLMESPISKERISVFILDAAEQKTISLGEAQACALISNPIIAGNLGEAERGLSDQRIRKIFAYRYNFNVVEGFGKVIEALKARQSSPHGPTPTSTQPITEQEQKLLAVANKFQQEKRAQSNINRKAKFLELSRILGLEVEFYVLNNWQQHLQGMPMPYEFIPANHDWMWVLCRINGTNEYFALPDDFSFLGKYMIVVHQIFDGWDISSPDLNKIEDYYTAARLVNEGNHNFKLVSKGFMKLESCELPHDKPVPPKPPTYEQILERLGAKAPQIDENELISLWSGCTSLEIFKSRFEPLGFKVVILINEIEGRQERIDSLWIASKDNVNYLFPAYHGYPLKMSKYATRLDMYYEYKDFGSKVIAGIDKLAKVEFIKRDGFLVWNVVGREKGELQMVYAELSGQELRLLAFVNELFTLSKVARRNDATERQFMETCTRNGLRIELYILDKVNFGSGASPNELQVLMPSSDKNKFEHLKFSSSNIALCQIEGTDEYLAVVYREFDLNNLMAGLFGQRIIFVGFDEIPRDVTIEKVYRAARIRIEQHDRFNVVVPVLLGYIKLKDVDIPSRYLPTPPEPPRYENFVR